MEHFSHWFIDRSIKKCWGKKTCRHSLFAIWIDSWGTVDVTRGLVTRTCRAATIPVRRAEAARISVAAGVARLGDFEAGCSTISVDVPAVVHGVGIICAIRGETVIHGCAIKVVACGAVFRLPFQIEFVVFVRVGIGVLVRQILRCGFGEIDAVTEHFR